jgi:hypothetical protein
VGQVATEHTIELLQCSPRHTFASLSHDRRYLRIRCLDKGCPDVVYAMDTGQVCIHVFDLHHRDLRWWSEFEPKGAKPGS